MYKLNNGLNQEQFYKLSAGQVLGPKMVNNVKKDNPLDLSEAEIISLLNLSWKYEKPMIFWRISSPVLFLLS